MLCTTAYLGLCYASLPEILPVHFRWDGQVNGWQYRTVGRVLMPVLVQCGLAATLGAVGALLLFRGDDADGEDEPGVAAARVAAEAILLMASIWILFQSYVAIALVGLWRGGAPTLGRGYTAAAIVGLILTGAVGARAQSRLDRPTPLPYDSAHWRLGHLYCHRDHPALFVPTRDGRRWTLNFGRPVAALLLGTALTLGIVVPSAILAAALR